MLTIIYHIMDQKSHPSIRMIRQLCHVHAMYLFFIDKYPQLQEKINGILNDFLSSENNRDKDHVPNLGYMIAMMYACPKYKFNDIS